MSEARPAPAEHPAPRIDAGFLESAFDRHPDEPKEVLVKAHLLSVGQWFTDAALEATAGALVKSYRLFSYDLVPMSDLKRRESRRVPEWFTILGGPYGLRPVNVQTTLSPTSPYRVDVVDGRLALTLGGEVLSEVRFPRAPSYYDLELPDGTKYHEVIALGFFLTAFRACQFVGADEECGFCDINHMMRQMNRSRDFTLKAPVKSPEDVAIVADAIEREAGGADARVAFLITGGSILETLNGKTEEEFYADYVRALKDGHPNRHISLQTNALPKERLRRFRDLGVDSHHANMEVWDPRLFEWICPGKAKRVGRDEWVRRLVDAVDLFGPGQVKPLFVGGIEMARPHGFATVDEAVASTTEGMEYLMSRGVVPRFNQWRREPYAWLVRDHEQPEVPLDYYARLMRNRYELWKANGLPLPNQSRLVDSTRHLGVAHGTHEDEILLLEETYPDDILDLVDRDSTPFEF
ncbi:MAG: radical SAM protein [Planctomycetota bacterium JB042]